MSDDHRNARIGAERVRAEWLGSYVGALASLPGNPRGAVIKRFGPVTALAAKNLPLAGLFNAAWGVTKGALDCLEEMLAFYRSIGISPRVHVSLAEHTDELGRALRRAGFEISSFDAILAGQVDPLDAEEPERSERGPEVVEVHSEEDLELFRDVYLEGFGWLPPWGQLMWDGVSCQLQGWRFFLCRVDGEPYSAGILFQSGSIGYMAAAATRPGHRGRGAHKALLMARRAAALAAGSTHLVGACEFNNQISFSNQQRIGLALTSVEAVWSQREEA